MLSQSDKKLMKLIKSEINKLEGKEKQEAIEVLNKVEKQFNLPISKFRG